MKIVNDKAKFSQKHQYRVVSFKLLKKQSDTIKQSCMNGTYPSVSETVRIAILDFLSYITEVTDGNKSAFWVDTTSLDQYNSSKAIKQSTCAKMPTKLLELVNQTLKQHPEFINRTNFIRLAVERFLLMDDQIYQPWLSIPKFKREHKAAFQSGLNQD